MSSTDEKFINKTLQLAKKAKGSTHPNPMVGALIVKNNRIIASGYHKRAGSAHAEIIALKKAKGKARGSKLYVNLEPCSRFGKTPPCVDEIIKNKIKEVIIATLDPNPINRHKGINRLKKHGIKVTSGILKKEADKLNEDFSKFITKKIPFVTVKVAQSLDGKMATITGDSKWISSFISRRYAHRLRAQSDAILVGVETILKDNPQLNCRYYKASTEQPIKIIVDSQLRTPKNAKILSKKSELIIATTKYASKKKIKELKDKKVTILVIKSKNRRVDLKRLLRELAKRGVVNILIEGGSQVITSFLRERLVDKMVIFIAPKIIGGKDALTFFEGKGIKKMKSVILLKDMTYKRLNNDVVIEGYVYPVR